MTAMTAMILGFDSDRSDRSAQCTFPVRVWGSAPVAVSVNQLPETEASQHFVNVIIVANCSDCSDCSDIDKVITTLQRPIDICLKLWVVARKAWQMEMMFRPGHIFDHHSSAAYHTYDGG